jgi:transcriptional repressor NrdR
MVCIYCDSPTKVVNSRRQKKLMQVWRRRACSSCGAVFTTNELVDLSSSLAVRTTEGHLRPFSRDKLYVSIMRACGHRKAAIGDSGALTATIIAKLRRQTIAAELSPAQIMVTTLQTLQHFDNAAGVQYAAYHQLVD